MSQESDWCDPALQPSARPGLQDGRPAGDNGMRLGLSSLCGIGLQPLFIGGLLKDLLVRHFADEKSIQQADLRSLVWSRDERTGILIATTDRWDGKLPDKRPAVVIKDNEQHNVRVAIGDRNGVTPEGHELYSTSWAGSHTCFCLSENGTQAKLLAHEVATEITEFGPVLLDTIPGLQSFRTLTIGASARVKGYSDNHRGIPVTVGWVYGHDWKLERESRRVRSIGLDVLIDGLEIRN